MHHPVLERRKVVAPAAAAAAAAACLAPSSGSRRVLVRRPSTGSVVPTVAKPGSGGSRSAFRLSRLAFTKR